MHQSGLSESSQVPLLFIVTVWTVPSDDAVKDAGSTVMKVSVSSCFPLSSVPSPDVLISDLAQLTSRTVIKIAGTSLVITCAVSYLAVQLP